MVHNHDDRKPPTSGVVGTFPKWWVVLTSYPKGQLNPSFPNTDSEYLCEWTPGS